MSNIKYQHAKMSQTTPKCEYSDCRNVGVITSQCTECDKYFCNEHRETHVVAEH
jgi:predicted nucleic acid binding AN1-type Zn finger protein